MIDAALIERHRRFEDLEAGIVEEFLRPTIGGARTIAVLTRPTGPARDVGWVVCPSFGEEQANLYRLEVMTARALGRAGFPVLRFHGQGYGDSEGAVEAVSLSSHLADAADAVTVLREHAPVGRVGVVGASFGGAVSALVADRLDLPLMVLCQPECDGDSYVRSLLRSKALARMASVEEGSNAEHDQEGLRRELSEGGWVDVNGFPLSARAAAEIAELDLVRDLGRFRGRSLIIGITRSGRADPSLEALVTALELLGGRSELSLVRDAQAPRFGRTRPGGGFDPTFVLEDRIAREIVDWGARMSGSAA